MEKSLSGILYSIPQCLDLRILDSIPLVLIQILYSSPGSVEIAEDMDNKDCRINL